MAQAKVINIEDAKLKTLTVEIKAMTVNGKQMTLSTFRQLQEENIFGEDYVLNGIPWGVVRYYFEESKGWQGNGFHVVWQKDKTLFRWFLHRVRSSFVWADRMPISAEFVEYEDLAHLLEKDRRQILVEQMNGAKTRLAIRHNRSVDQLALLPQLFIAV